MKPLVVIESFVVTGRGLIVALDGTTDQPAGRALSVKVMRPNGTHFLATAFKEWPRPSHAAPVESECFFLRDVAKTDVPMGSKVIFDLVR